MNNLRLFLLPPPALVFAMIGLSWFASWDRLNNPQVVPLLFATNAPVEASVGTDTFDSLVPDHSVQDANLPQGIAEQSLFLTARRPWAEPTLQIDLQVPEPEKEASQVFQALAQPNIRYLGRVGTYGKLTALVSDVAGQHERWVEIDEEIRGWSVVEIRPEELRLRAGSQELVVKLDR